MKRFAFYAGLVLLLAGCQHHHDSDTPTPESWQRVEAFSDMPILGLAVSSDSTELNLLTNLYFGHRYAGGDPTAFTSTHVDYLPDANIQGFSKYPAWIDDQNCIYSNSQGNALYVYDIASGSPVRKGILSVYSLVPDSTCYDVTFCPAMTVNSINHTIGLPDGRYLLSVRTAYNDGRGMRFDHFVGSFRFDGTEWASFDVDYALPPVESVYQSDMIGKQRVGNKIFLSYGMNPPNLEILDAQSGTTTFSSVYCQLREVFRHNDYLVGLGDGVVIRSDDDGQTWNPDNEYWEALHGAFMHASLCSRDILYGCRDLEEWDLDNDPEHTRELNVDGLPNVMITRLVEFDGKIYAATPQGLFCKGAGSLPDAASTR